MRADEVPVGSGFLGCVDAADWREHFKSKGGLIPGEFVHVQCVLPTAGREYLRQLVKLHAEHLPTSSEYQLNSTGLWVAGVRDTKSKKVRLFEWETRLPKTHLEELHQLMVVEHEMHQAHAKLERVANYRIPFL